jgi:hypothetical protein
VSNSPWPSASRSNPEDSSGAGSRRETGTLESFLIAEPCPLSPRKAEELPWQLARAADWARLVGLLADPAFLQEALKLVGEAQDLAPKNE